MKGLRPATPRQNWELCKDLICGCDKVQDKEGRGQGWREETRVVLFN